MWIYKLVDMEFWIPDFDRAEIYNRLKGFYNHVLGTAGMHSVQTNDLALKSDIDQIRSALKGGQCKLYILSKKGQEHLVLEYANIKNEVPDTRRLKAHFFSQRRFYLLPSPDQFIFFKNEMTKNGGRISIEVLIDKLRVTEVIDEALLYEKLVNKKDKLPSGYQIRKINLDSEVFRSLDPMYQGPMPSIGKDWGFDENPEHFEIDRGAVNVKKTDQPEPSPAERLIARNRKLVYEGRQIPLNAKEFEVFVKEMINQIKSYFHREADVHLKIRGFLVALRLILADHNEVDPGVFKVLGEYFAPYRKNRDAK
jgi:hypothetical protein